MKQNFFLRKKFWAWLITLVVVLPAALLGTVLLVIYLKQDTVIQQIIATVNKEHQGLIEVGDTHLEPFENFPHVSIKVDDVRIYETKADDSPLGLKVADIYLGFNLFDILTGNFDVQSLVIEDGFFNIILHEDGTNNIQNALATTSAEEEESAPLDIHLKKIVLRNLDIHKLNEGSNTDIETFIYNAEGGFQSEDEDINAHIDTEFELNVVDNGDTTFIKRKHFEFHTDITIHGETGVIDIKPSGITLEHGDFELEGSLDPKNDMTVDLAIKGTKPNFDMFIAFAPEDIIPVLERYKNAGNIYFNAIVSGPTANDQLPFIEAQFGASNAFLENTSEGKRMDELGFKGYFTNGRERNLQTMEFSITDMKASLEEGRFVGALKVRNFEEPEVKMQLDADFNLDFLAGFLNLDDIQGAEGSVALQMKFNDIIDLDNPQQAFDDLNRAYFTELKITDLSLSSSKLKVPLDRLNAHLIMNGKRAELDLFEVQMGESDLSITGYLTDLPAIVHHTDDAVEVHMEIASKVLDIAALTGFSEADSTGVDERIVDFRTAFSFESTARAFTESEYLPRGEFFIERLHAQLKHYPHELHDFHVDVLIDDRDLQIKDFTGYIDASDFHFNGLIHDYGFWMKPQLNGDVDLDITLESKLLHLEDIFSYKGENFVPEDYRHEEFERLALHVNSSMHFKDSALESIDLELDRFDTKMHIHPMRFEDFTGRFHYEDEHLMIEQFHGKIGRTVFDLDLNYYLGEDQELSKRDNHIGLEANYIDFDQLFNFQPAPAPKVDPTAEKTTADVAEHAEAFNLYELPFTDMTIDVDVGHFIYHKVDLQKIKARLRTTQDHYVHVDTLRMHAAGGKIRMSGYFNGSDPEHIYAKPKLVLQDVNVDELLFKFESFGQDIELSENLRGKLSARINGNVRIYPDFVPDLDQSEVHMDVRVLDGRLVDYEPMLLLADYMGDKDLTNIRFDTLQNHMDITNGEMSIPSMTIESTLGHFEVSGKQDFDFNMEYYVRVPWKVVTSGAKQKLFGKKKDDEADDKEDEIVQVDPDKRVRYLNLKIDGTIEDYSISTGKDKKK